MIGPFFVRDAKGLELVDWLRPSPHASVQEGRYRGHRMYRERNEAGPNIWVVWFHDADDARDIIERTPTARMCVIDAAPKIALFDAAKSKKVSVMAGHGVSSEIARAADGESVAALEHKAGKAEKQTRKDLGIDATSDVQVEPRELPARG